MVKGCDGALGFDMLLCLMSCQDIWTAVGWDGMGRGGGVIRGGSEEERGKQLSRDLGRGYRAEKKLS